ncbi:MAG: YbjN domain-containing protein [Novosphingobium sp.]|uniref:YbjN domain-containing protein n=1 Tax=Novosphingobium sp. TaxID=1874826 RepID=UPI003C7CC5F7
MTAFSLRRTGLIGLPLAALALGSAPGLAAPAATSQTPATLRSVPAMISAKDPKSIMAALRAKGWSPELSETDDGVPSIEFTVDKIITTIRFYNCNEDGKDCSTLNFYVGFAGTKYSSMEGINTYNAKKRFGRAYLDDVGDPCLEMDIDLDFAGLPRENFLEYLNTWNLLTHDFRDYINESDDS